MSALRDAALEALASVGFWVAVVGLTLGLFAAAPRVYAAHKRGVARVRRASGG